MTRAIRILDWNTFETSEVDGSFFVRPRNENSQDLAFFYVCPCGCKNIGKLRAGLNYKPVQQPSWNWNGSDDKATLQPSVNHVDHWHGWLIDGEWKVC